MKRGINEEGRNKGRNKEGMKDKRQRNKDKK